MYTLVNYRFLTIPKNHLVSRDKLLRLSILFLTMSKNVIYNTILIILNIVLSIIPHFFVRPLWIPHSPSLKYVTLFEVFYTLLILPILLLILNKKLYPQYKFKPFINFGLIFTAILLSNHFHYQNFANMTGHGEDPDIGTKILSIVVPIIAILITGTSIAVSFYKQRKRQKE